MPILPITFILFLLTACSVSDQKYNAGDCITPIDENYSWHGEYAKIEAFTRVNGQFEKRYILAFPNTGSNSSIFNKEIEGFTKKVSQENCL